jgi:hypothetical protein
MNDLLKEAIADAKAVRETALANAKLALEEAFTPRLQSMLSNKIEEEMEEEEDDTVEEQTDSSNIGAGDNKVDVADGDDEEKSETETTSTAYGSEDSNNTVVDKLTEAEDDEDPEEMMKEEEDEDHSEMAYKEEDDLEEADLDLEAIIRELEEDDDEEKTEGEDEDHSEMKDMEEEEEVEETEDREEVEETEETEDEEVDLDEIIQSLKEEEDDETKEEDDPEEMMKKEVAELSTRLKEAYGTIKSLKGTINEVNLLNAKLLFSNKLFKSHNLTEGQKMKIIETFDRAQSTREVKLVYSTLAESLSAGASKKSTIKEGFASKATRSTKPSPKAVIVEADQFTNRMKKLAGLV